MIEAAKATVMDLYCLSICQSYSASDLAEAAVSIACRQNNVEFDFEHALIRKVTAGMLVDYESMMDLTFDRYDI